MDATAASLRTNGTFHLSKIDLAAAGVHTHKTTGLADSDVASRCFQVRAAANLARANMSAATVQRSVPRDDASVDVAPCSERAEIASHIEHLDVPALGFQLGNWTAAGPFPNARTANAPDDDGAALGSQIGGAGNIAGPDVT